MRDGRNFAAWSLPLLPAGWLYCKLNGLRANLYRHGMLKSQRLDRPTLSIGNLTFGGTGKTPLTLHIAETLLARGRTPAILLRGYGRKTTGPRLVQADSPPSEVGDEALLYATRIPAAPIAVAEHRELGARLLPARPDLYLLDDGFQHLRIRRDADILLVDARRPFDLRPAPMGRLRESLSAAGRADLIILTGGGIDDLPASLRRKWEGRSLARLRFDWEQDLLPLGAGTLSDLKGVPLCAFAGIGSPGAFFDQARSLGLKLRETIVFPDHAYPTPERLERVMNSARRHSCGFILTTEKDWVKWGPAWKEGIPLVACRLKTRLDDPDGCLDRLLDGLGGERA